MNKENQYDSIIIGSGMSGMTASTILARYFKKRVLILEKSAFFGGLTHSFHREKNGMKWDFHTGVHYLGDDKNKTFIKIIDYISAGEIKWAEFPDEYDFYVYGNKTYKIPKGRENLTNYLISEFPHEKKGILAWLKDVQTNATSVVALQTTANFTRSQLLRSILKFFIGLQGKHLDKTAREATALYVKDVHLQNILLSMFGNYGMEPERASFYIHSVVFDHYVDGAILPKEGSDMLSSNIKKVLEKHGATILTETPVNKIIIENGKAVGVSTPKGDFYATDIISTAGAYNTYVHLIPETYAQKERETLKKWEAGVSLSCLYFGFGDGVEKLGIKGNNFWVHALDKNGKPVSTSIGNSKERQLSFIKEGEALHSFMSFSSFTTGIPKGATNHSGEVLFNTLYDYWTKYQPPRSSEVQKEYEDVKARIITSATALLEKQYPGISKYIEHVEFASPLTMEMFTHNHKGQQYYVAQNVDRFNNPIFRPYTPIKNLYLGGSDVITLGVMGACIGGVVSAVSTQAIPTSEYQKLIQHIFKNYGKNAL